MIGRVVRSRRDALSAWSLSLALTPWFFTACNNAEEIPDEETDATKTPRVAAPTLAGPEPELVEAVKPTTVKTIPRAPAAGFRHISIQDAVPMCVFSSYKAFDSVASAAEVAAQQLAADEPLFFGFFPGWCVSERCDDAPSLQCAVDQEGDVLKVTARYWGDRIADPTCKPGPCRKIASACSVSSIAAGSYTIVYGNRTFELTIPSAPDDPCFGTRDAFGPPDTGTSRQNRDSRTHSDEGPTAPLGP